MNKIVTGLWLNKSKSGKKYLSGSLGIFGWRIAIFKNENKQTDKSPDYNLVIERSTNIPNDPTPTDFSPNPMDDGDMPF